MTQDHELFITSQYRFEITNEFADAVAKEIWRSVPWWSSLSWQDTGMMLSAYINL
jgi:hypothetical protein